METAVPVAVTAASVSEQVALVLAVLAQAASAAVPASWEPAASEPAMAAVSGQAAAEADLAAWVRALSGLALMVVSAAGVLVLV